METINANWKRTTDNQDNDILMGKATFIGFAGENKLTNSNGTEYRLANVAFLDTNGNRHESSAAIYDKVLSKSTFTDGDTVSVAAREYNGSMYLSVIGITGAGTLAADSGAFAAVEATEDVDEEVEATA